MTAFRVVRDALVHWFRHQDRLHPEDFSSAERRAGSSARLSTGAPAELIPG